MVRVTFLFGVQYFIFISDSEEKLANLLRKNDKK